MAKKRILGCSFPVFIFIAIMLLALFVVSLVSGPMGKNLLGLPEWLIVSKPHPELPAEVVFHLFGLPITNSIIATWLTIIFLASFSFIITRKLTLIPGRKQALLEVIIESLLNFCQSVAGKKNGRRFFPVVATIFLFVAFNAWLSLLPGYGSITAHTAESEVHFLRGANTDINTPLAVAAISFIFIEFVGFSTLGIRYGKKFINLDMVIQSVRLFFKGKIKAALSGFVLGVINAFIGLVELLSELIRVVSLTIRLFGNMTAGEILLLVAIFLMPWLFALPFYALELLVGFVQALIFASLTLIFLTMAVSSHEEHGEEPAGH